MVLVPVLAPAPALVVVVVVHLVGGGGTTLGGGIASDRSTCATFYVELKTDWNAQSQTDTITAFKVDIYNIEDGYNDRPCVGNTDQLLQMVEWPSFAHRWV